MPDGAQDARRQVRHPRPRHGPLAHRGGRRRVAARLPGRPDDDVRRLRGAPRPRQGPDLRAALPGAVHGLRPDRRDGREGQGPQGLRAVHARRLTSTTSAGRPLPLKGGRPWTTPARGGPSNRGSALPVETGGKPVQINKEGL